MKVNSMGGENIEAHLHQLFADGEYGEILKLADQCTTTGDYNPWISLYISAIAFFDNEDAIQKAVEGFESVQEPAFVFFGRGSAYLAFMNKSVEVYLQAINPIVLGWQNSVNNIAIYTEQTIQEILEQCEMASHSIRGREFDQYREMCIERTQIANEEAQKVMEPLNKKISSMYCGVFSIIEKAAQILSQYECFNQEDYRSLENSLFQLHQSVVVPLMNHSDNIAEIRYEKAKKVVNDVIEGRKEYSQNIIDSIRNEEAENFWKEHSQDKERITSDRIKYISKKKSLNQKLQQLNESLSNEQKQLKDKNEYEVELEEIEKNIALLTSERDSLGFFTGSKKKKISEELSVLSRKHERIKRLAKEERDYLEESTQKNIKAIEFKIRNFQNELTEIQYKIDQLDAILEFPLTNFKSLCDSEVNHVHYNHSSELAVNTTVEIKQLDGTFRQYDTNHCAGVSLSKEHFTELLSKLDENKYAECLKECDDYLGKDCGDAYAVLLKHLVNGYLASDYKEMIDNQDYKNYMNTARLQFGDNECYANFVVLCAKSIVEMAIYQTSKLSAEQKGIIDAALAMTNRSDISEQQKGIRLKSILEEANTNEMKVYKPIENAVPCIGEACVRINDVEKYSKENYIVLIRLINSLTNAVNSLNKSSEYVQRIMYRVSEAGKSVVELSNRKGI